ncbi:hypothetical protein HYW55_00840 [Candidatus Gottesmanbacteria bacterium]|nr:hypothetical protein [Candidatus Gottesmanbacteria bacterium]
MSKKKIYVGSIIAATAVLAVLTVFLSQNISTQKQETRTQATVSDREIKLSLFPKSQKGSVEERISVAAKIVGIGNRKIASVLLSIRFDSSHLKLQSIDPSKKADGMSFLKGTDSEKANNQGSFKILYGAESENSAPQGVVNLPSFSFEIIKEAKSDVSIVISESQVIFVDGVNGELKEDGHSAIIDSVPTGTHTPQEPTSVEISPTVVETISPTGEITPTVSE